MNRWSVEEAQSAASGGRYGGAVGDDEIERRDIRGTKDVRDGTGELRVE